MFRNQSKLPMDSLCYGWRLNLAKCFSVFNRIISLIFLGCWSGWYTDQHSVVVADSHPWRTFRVVRVNLFNVFLWSTAICWGLFFLVATIMKLAVGSLCLSCLGVNIIKGCENQLGTAPGVLSFWGWTVSLPSFFLKYFVAFIYKTTLTDVLFWRLSILCLFI